MKNILYVLFYALFFSCSTQKKNNLNEKYTAPISIERKLTSTESKIINDFIDVELKKERYKNYRDAEIVIIEEALNKHQSVETYIYSNNEWISMNKVNRREDIENQYFLYQKMTYCGLHQPAATVALHNLHKLLKKIIYYYLILINT